jgi:ribosome-binding protein aMBF1 (putative translation factor)
MSNKITKDNNNILSDLLAEITPQKQKRTDNKMLLAAKIKDGINNKNWRNIDLAEALSQKPSVITKWLSGTHNFTADTLSDIEEALSIKLLAVDNKKEHQIIHYRLNVTTTVTNKESSSCNATPVNNLLYPLSESETTYQA